MKKSTPKKAAAGLPGRISNASSKKIYRGDGYDPGAMRKGANDFLAIPSRMGNTLHYRGGRKAEL